jgi:Holliday junction resolvasome RuvABC ATP-dependent DNA helicase subunit
MMAIDEGRELLFSSVCDNGFEDLTSPPQIVEICIDNADPKVVGLATLSLAVGNAADAVEIIAIGFILSELSHVSQTDKGDISRHFVLPLRD